MVYKNDNYPANMKKRKHILFVGLSLKVGGIERALVEQVNALDKNVYDIDLFLFHRGGEYLQYVSPQVNVLKTNLAISSMAMTNDEAKQHKVSFIIRTIMYLLSKIIGNRRLYSVVFGCMKSLKGYDVAVSYFHDGNSKGLYYGSNLFVLEKVEARKKVAWIHSDPMLMKAGSQDNRELYRRFDSVVNVSLAMKQKFDRMGIVELDRSKVVYNRYDEPRILRLAEDTIDLWHDKVTLVTVGRLENNKGTLELLNVALRLREKGFNFIWFFVGTGCQEEEAKKYVNDNALNDYIVFTGQIANPYPYIKHADLMVSGSLTETFGLSILEALILNTPVAAYRYDAIDEVVHNGVNGIVADTFEDLYLKIAELLSNLDKLKGLKESAKPLLDYNSLNISQIKEVL